ncbi:acid-sensing ion channel 1-like isoform X2 [Patiria miniata]|uniref:Uncharacterized protein n=1 Tax=Patiria miniata TaxID=46514 RepID=A0A913ZUL9_PATMI|nr:acid-sensing ion channel 1-like isoform X2 [Patiria miniata]
MGKSSVRVQALSNGGADDPTRSFGESVFAITDNSSSTSGLNDGTERREIADDPVCQEVKEKRKLLFREFASDTSLHGIKYVTNPKHHKFRRFVWLILVLVAFIGFIVTTVDHLQKFLKYDTSTSLTYITQPNQTLPAITICNYNAFKKSAVINSGWESIIPVLLPYVTKASIPQSQVDVDVYENITLPDWDVNETNERWGHRIEDMLLECQWKQGYNCGPQDFKMVWTDLGPCYTFNGGNVSQAGADASPYVVNGTTSEEGLRIRLNLEQYDYLATPYDTAGFKIKGKKSPYVTNCTDGGLKYFATYTPNTCLIECLTDAAFEECGCFLPWTSGGDGEVCDFETAASCSFNALVGVDCPCNMPCLEEQYKTRVSMTATPAQYAIPTLCDKYNMTQEEIRNNIVDLYIYFEDMRVTVIEHKGAYEFYDLTSDVGGEIGLLLGASVLTLFEFLDYLAVYHMMGLALLKKCYHRHFGKRR